MTAYGGADQGAPAGPEQPEELVERPADTQPLAHAMAPNTAILRQIQHHLGITSAPEHAIPSSSEPSQAPPFC
ncbi:hypothetical protein CK203_060533 [Vitis vinifera]|uniref:Uncharacterized protein n=1 Tax=Vitis vinifera TaxID=29760 RepID=A0A438GDT0_VITVI|nr:hypothetical protein CK203_060533 [Vitis vinifera]